MIYPGSDLKFLLTVDKEGFDLSNDPFAISVYDRYRRERWRITREVCFCDDKGNWYFSLERVPAGVLMARFTGFIPDNDFNSTYRRFVDVQRLCTVGFGRGFNPCPCRDDKHHANYRLIEAENLDNSTYLRGSDGSFISTADDRRIEITPSTQRKVTLDTLTGESFKEMIEGRSDDGLINTVPEVLDVMQGFDEDSELAVMTDADTDEMMQRILNVENL